MRPRFALSLLLGMAAFLSQGVAAPNVPVRLYDLKSDPNETTNLAELQPERVRDLQERITQWLP